MGVSQQNFTISGEVTNTGIYNMRLISTDGLQAVFNDATIHVVTIQKLQNNQLMWLCVMAPVWPACPERSTQEIRYDNGVALCVVWEYGSQLNNITHYLRISFTQSGKKVFHSKCTQQSHVVFYTSREYM